MFPTTFTCRGRHIITIESKEQARRLPHGIRAYCAFSIAQHCCLHFDAVLRIQELGLAEDVADADALIREGEESQL